VIPLPVAPIGRECIIGILQTREVEPVTMVEVIILESWTVVLVAILGALIVAAVIFAAIQVRRENRRNIAIGYGSTSKRKSAEKDNRSW
jgi:hypothetical protein